jgi:hypothetical protein
MIGSLFDHWKYTGPEIWSALARSRRAPADLFIELYRTASDFLLNPPEYKQFELSMNDPVQAGQAFEDIRAQDLGSEVTVIAFMEAAFDTIDDFGIARYANLYKRLVKSFSRKYNLRYRVDDRFKLRLVLPGAFASFYEELSRLHRTDGHLGGLMNDFEQAFGSYARSKQSHDLRTCILKATIYAEGIAGKTDGTTDTLGAICNRLACWPHITVRESLKKLYGFCSDYPGIRHPGNPEAKLRELEYRDAILISLLLVSFSGYLSNEVRMEDTLAPPAAASVPSFIPARPVHVPPPGCTSNSPALHP